MAPFRDATPAATWSAQSRVSLLFKTGRERLTVAHSKGVGTKVSRSYSLEIIEGCSTLSPHKQLFAELNLLSHLVLIDKCCS